MEHKERDLGFFNGIKAELIPLIIGLVSFSLVVDSALNQLESLFFIDDESGIHLFIIVYFLFPVVMILGWLSIMNHRDGLKNILMKTKGATLTIVLIIFAGFILLLLAIYTLNVQQFLVAALLQFGLILVYLLLVSIFDRKRNYKYKREYRQAGMQLGIVFTALCLFWTLYFSASIYKGEFKTQWENRDTTLNVLISNGAKERTIYESKSKAAKELVNYLQDFSLLPKHPVPLLDVQKLSWQYVTEKHHLQFHTLLGNDSLNNLADLAVDEFTTRRKVNLDSVKYIVNRIQDQALHTYKAAWAPWLRVIQFEGLIIFNLLLLFLLVVWYHAYKSQLTANDSNDYSEITISKISIYLLFLLIIPFFKPIQEETISFGKPYVGNENSIGTIINNKYEVESKPCNCPTPQSIEYDTLAKKVKNELKKDLDEIDEQLKQVKKYPQKQQVP